MNDSGDGGERSLLTMAGTRHLLAAYHSLPWNSPMTTSIVASCRDLSNDWTRRSLTSSSSISSHDRPGASVADTMSMDGRTRPCSMAVVVVDYVSQHDLNDGNRAIELRDRSFVQRHSKPRAEYTCG